MDRIAGHTIVIGAGIGGLATAMRLVANGMAVTVLERHSHVGGKMRTIDSEAGPVDAGPTVMTLRTIFENLFAACGDCLEDHVTLTPAEVLARHWWSDGTTLDLTNDSAINRTNISETFGPADAKAFETFCGSARRLFEAFDEPMMQKVAPRQTALVMQVLQKPKLILDMTPLQNLAQRLASQFGSPHLQQLFGRYATYVGGSPYEAPGLLSLIWHAEASGVWSISGGMHRLAEAMASVIEAEGGRIRTRTGVKQIAIQDDHVTGIVTDDGTQIAADQVVYNGDPRALSEGLLGARAQSAVQETHVSPRSLSAYVWSFAAKSEGVPLSHHNVFFADDARAEFADIKAGRMPRDATLYLCAQDRGGGALRSGAERFEIIMNGAPTSATAPLPEEKSICKARTFERLTKMGLIFASEPPESALTTPADFNALFPGSMGSLYGRSPHGLTAGLKRPTARTPIKGLYLAGGGAHPGAGIPMAALSGRHAAEAILTDQTSTSMSPRMATPGGMSTGSAKMASGPSRSSAS